jgi:hypothetical protein
LLLPSHPPPPPPPPLPSLPSISILPPLPPLRLCTGYWKFSGRCTSHRNPPSPQLEYSSYDSWTALGIGRRVVSTPFAASTFTRLSTCCQASLANVSPHHFSSPPYSSLLPTDCSISQIRKDDYRSPFYNYFMSVLQLSCPLCTVPVNKPLCMQ